MYGMVNQAVKDLVVSKFGNEAWNKICLKMDMSNEDFVFMQYYPDKVTYDLVRAASEQLGASADVILTEFGKHWVMYTAQEGYGPMMDLFGQDFKTCLQNLNNLHARMGMSLPHLSPPRFVFIEESNDTFLLEYYSSRGGLGSMVQGLIEGLALKYKVEVQISSEEVHTGECKAKFKIKIL